jgi:hypothetical protein
VKSFAFEKSYRFTKVPGDEPTTAFFLHFLKNELNHSSEYLLLFPWKN